MQRGRRRQSLSTQVKSWHSSAWMSQPTVQMSLPQEICRQISTSSSPIRPWPPTLTSTAIHSGDTSNIAASRKHSKYDPLIARHHLKFQLIAC
eukprot:SAG25_NODE_969_length_4493_cov_4.706190_1_plen_92_part_10